jgi:serine/threonine protein kinase
MQFVKGTKFNCNGRKYIISNVITSEIFTAVDKNRQKFTVKTRNECGFFQRELDFYIDVGDVGNLGIPRLIAYTQDYMILSFFQIQRLELDTQSLKLQIIEMIKILQFIHFHGYIHDNIVTHHMYRDENGKYFLTDYGMIEKMSNTNGTPRDDLYSLAYCSIIQICNTPDIYNKWRSISISRFRVEIGKELINQNPKLKIIEEFLMAVLAIGPFDKINYNHLIRYLN